MVDLNRKSLMLYSLIQSMKVFDVDLQEESFPKKKDGNL